MVSHGSLICSNITSCFVALSQYVIYVIYVIYVTYAIYKPFAMLWGVPTVFVFSENDVPENCRHAFDDTL
jgi:hypothetical protein